MGKVLGARDIDLLGQCNAYDQHTVKQIEKKVGKITEKDEFLLKIYFVIYKLYTHYQDNYDIDRIINAVNVS